MLTGEGNIFSAGVDLVRVLKEGGDSRRALIPALSALFATLFFYPKPVVAAVNRHAIAVGCVLACAADHRIMARGTGRMGVRELVAGVPFLTVTLEIMRFVTKSQHLQTPAYGGATCLSADAARLGSVDELVEPSDLLERALESAEKLAIISQQVFEHTKKQIGQPVLVRVRRGESSFESSLRDMWTAPETLEAMRSYVSRTLKKA